MTARTTMARRSGAGRTRATKPTLRVERSLQRDGYAVLAGMDEVGRGALAGPVSVGVVLIDPTCGTAPVGVRDSKLLTAPAREALVSPIERWSRGHAVGHAWPDEIDALGIIAALRLAGRRALSALSIVPDLVILDGNHDWLTDPIEVGLFAHAEVGSSPPVTTLVKADLTCSSVAAASILAKVTRDALMVDYAELHPAYAWAENKGYAAPEHLAALVAKGPCALHRRSWRLPGVGDSSPGAVETDSPKRDVESDAT